MDKFIVFKKEHFPSFVRTDRIKEFKTLKDAKKFVLKEFSKNRMDVPKINELKKESSHLISEERVIEIIFTCKDTPTIEYIINKKGNNF